MTAFSRRALLTGGTALAATAALPATLSLSPTAAAAPRQAGGRPDRAVLQRWARRTWASLVAMTDERTGLSADNIDGPLDAPNRSGYTSPTNIGGYLWSTIVARDLGLISRGEASRRLSQTLDTLSRMRRHGPSGMFYNWYDERTAEVLTSWPTDGKTVYPFLSSVDNGWLAAAFVVLGNAAEPSIGRRALRLLEPMDFRAYYNPTPRPDLPVGLLRGGFWPEKPPTPSDTVEANYLGRGPNVFYTNFHYDTTVSETRIASYLGIARGQIPPGHFFGTWRTFPSGCDWSWQESRPVGRTRTYLGVDVFEGAYEYRGFRVVPGWGGSMFEALMPNVFVPEERWAPHSWGVNHPLMVRAHREHGLDEAKYGFWGFSPASDPTLDQGYREYGVDAVGLNPDGYFSDVEKTNVDRGFGDCREAKNPNPTYGDGVVTPHAAFLAMMHEPGPAYANLRKLEREFDCTSDGGFFDAIAVGSGKVARRFLSLDQAMIMGALGNLLGRGLVQRAFSRGAIERAIKPLIGMERFGAGS
ncbi:glucoamylase family protein [Microlunatus ginsengisoli]|uniref:Glycoamylase-like domain-containing protein n=1 Tax=Microlunatus ginsengisoli TaxID=363863 RepID=A0ABP7AEI7_9ACTN